MKPRPPPGPALYSMSALPRSKKMTPGRQAQKAPSYAKRVELLIRTDRPMPHFRRAAHFRALPLDRRSFSLGVAATVFTLTGCLSRAQSTQTRTDDSGSLTFAPGLRRLKPEPGPETAVWAANGVVPGPTFRVRRGGETFVRLRNDLPQPTSLHWHGVRLANAADGVAGLTQEAVAAGATRDIRFTPKDAGTFWYRPLTLPHAAEQTERGIHGLFLVEEDKPPAFDADIAVVLDDWALDDMNAVRASFGDPMETGFIGRLGNWLTVNGAPVPQTLQVAPGARLRVRIVNAANARPFTLRFEGLRVHVIAIDGQPTDPFEPARGIISLVPGSRFDLALDAPAAAGGQGRLLAALGAGVPLLVLDAAGSPSPLASSPIPALPGNDLPQAIELAKASRINLTIEGGADTRPAPGGQAAFADPARIWRFNGVAWPDARERPVLSVKAGTPVSIGLVNRTAFLQAIHVHGHHVRLLHAKDDGWEPYWLDTIPVAAGETARIAFVADNPGRWMIGSSILERLDSGLAAWFEVT